MAAAVAEARRTIERGAGGAEKDLNLMFSAAEAQWILTVLDDAAKKLSLSSYLTPEILKDRIMDAIDHDTVVAIKEHFEVEKQYAELLKKHQQRIEENGGEDIPMDEEQYAVFNEMDMCLSDSTRTVTRLLNLSPGFSRRLKQVCPKRENSSLEFINIFSRLRKLVHDKLRMTAEEEKAMKEQLAKLREEDDGDKRRYFALTEGLAMEQSEHKQTLAAKDRKIARLRKQIEELTIKTQREREQFEQKMQQEAELAQQIFEASEADLLNQLKETTDKMTNDGAFHYAEEMKEHRKKFFRGQEVEKLIEKYDIDMCDKKDTLDKLREMYKDESEELGVLGEYFDGVDRELQRQKDEIKALTIKRNEEMARNRTSHQAAVLFQKLFRGYHAKCLAGGKKKKGSKKGDKKKKKK